MPSIVKQSQVDDTGCIQQLFSLSDAKVANLLLLMRISDIVTMTVFCWCRLPVIDKLTCE